MAKYSQVQISEFPFHITARAHNKNQFSIPLEDVWKILTHHLSLVHYKYDFKIHAFVLMPNHFHLIGSTQEFELGHIMRAFLCESAKEINFKTHSINQVWGSRYFKCLITNTHYYQNVYKYVYQNPLRAGLVSRAEEWRFSTLNSLIGHSHLCLPMEPDTTIFNPDFDIHELDWLNQVIPNELLTLLKTALSRKSMRFPKSRDGFQNLIEVMKV